MIIGFGGLIIIMILGFFLYFKTDKERWMFISGFVGAILCFFFVFYSFNEPDILNYSINVENKRIYCNEYQMEGRNIKIPAYYVFENIWYNHYDYCGFPITIVVPEGQVVDIVDLRPIVKPYIVGGCE
jgi:hypothetical protein